MIQPYTLTLIAHSKLREIKPPTLNRAIEKAKQAGNPCEVYREEPYDGPYRRILPGAKANTTYIVHYFLPRFVFEEQDEQKWKVYDRPCVRIEKYGPDTDKISSEVFLDLDEEENGVMSALSFNATNKDGSKVFIANEFDDDCKLARIIEIHSDANSRCLGVLQGDPKVNREKGWQYLTLG